MQRILSYSVRIRRILLYSIQIYIYIRLHLSISIHMQTTSVVAPYSIAVKQFYTQIFRIRLVDGVRSVCDLVWCDGFFFLSLFHVIFLRSYFTSSSSSTSTPFYVASRFDVAATPLLWALQYRFAVSTICMFEHISSLAFRCLCVYFFLSSVLI